MTDSYALSSPSSSSSVSNFVVPAPIQALQLALLQCQPRSVIQFSLRFLNDEKLHASNTNLISIHHAIHMLPFLITRPDDFKDCCCTLFVSAQSTPNLFGDNNNSALAPTGTPYFREYLDGSTICELIQAMDVASLFTTNAVIDEVR